MGNRIEILDVLGGSDHLGQQDIGVSLENPLPHVPDEALFREEEDLERPSGQGRPDHPDEGPEPAEAIHRQVVTAVHDGLPLRITHRPKGEAVQVDVEVTVKDGQLMVDAQPVALVEWEGEPWRHHGQTGLRRLRAGHGHRRTA